MMYLTKSKIAMLGAVCILASACSSTKNGVVSTAAFYNMPMKLLKSNAGGYDDFQVFAKGANLNDCIGNAKMEVMKTLVYQGLRGSDATITPILNDAPSVEKFKQYENEFLIREANNPAVITTSVAEKRNDDLLQSKKMDAQASRPVTVSINRVAFKKDVLAFINSK